MPKINKEEYEVLKNLDDKWKWIARDEDRGLYAFTKKPVREDGPSPYWDTETEGPYTALELFDEIHLFQFIQWEDREPYNIAELIEEYLDDEYGYFNMKLSREFEEFIKKESEEAEVKNIEWAKKKIKEIHTLTFDSYEAAVIANNKHFQMKNSEQLALINKIMEILDQLDEPEVLSQEFINEKAVEVYADTADAEVHAVFRMRDLQNLLVPKQEEVTHKQVEKYLLDRNIRVIDIDVYEKMQSDLAEFENKIVIEKPVIPQFVADYIKWFKTDFEYNFAADIDFIISLIQVSHKFSRREKIKNWISKSGNAQKLIDAYRWGYEVEEEQKYYVMNNENELLLSKNKDDEVITYSQYYPQVRKVLSDLSHYQLTEQEIKGYDPRYTTFAKPVEELEEE